MKKSAYIGIDPSYTGFGLVIYLQGEGFEAHEEVLEDYSPAKAGTGASRLWLIHTRLRNRFASLNLTYDVRRVCMEGYAPGSKFGREVMGELGGILRLALVQTWPENIIQSVQPTSLKKFITGKGSATKDTVILAAYKKWGVTFEDNNLADAYGLARLAHTMENGTTIQYEQEVIAAATKGRPARKQKTS